MSVTTQDLMDLDVTCGQILLVMDSYTDILSKRQKNLRLRCDFFSKNLMKVGSCPPLCHELFILECAWVGEPRHILIFA